MDFSKLFSGTKKYYGLHGLQGVGKLKIAFNIRWQQ